MEDLDRAQILALPLDNRAPCPTCHGTGEVHSHNPRCWDCHGIGYVSKSMAAELTRRELNDRNNHPRMSSW